MTLGKLCGTPVSRWKLLSRKHQHKTWLNFIIMIPLTHRVLNNKVVIYRHFRMHFREYKLPYFDSYSNITKKDMLSSFHKYTEDWTNWLPYCKHFRMLHWIKSLSLPYDRYSNEIWNSLSDFTNWPHRQITICLVNDLAWNRLQSITWNNHIYMHASLDLSYSYIFAQNHLAIAIKTTQLRSLYPVHRYVKIQKTQTICYRYFIRKALCLKTGIIIHLSYEIIIIPVFGHNALRMKYL